MEDVVMQTLLDIKKPVRNIEVPESLLFGTPLDTTFVKEIHSFRDKYSSRLEAMETGYMNIANANEVQWFSTQDLDLLKIYLTGVVDNWFLEIYRNRTISFVRQKNRKAPVTERYDIHAELTDEQIEDLIMPERVVIAFLTHAKYIPASLDVMIAKAEQRVIDALAESLDKELRLVNEARREMNQAIEDLKNEKAKRNKINHEYEQNARTKH